MGALNQSFSKITKDRVLQPFAGYGSGGIGAGGGKLVSEHLAISIDEMSPG